MPMSLSAIESTLPAAPDPPEPSPAPAPSIHRNGDEMEIKARAMLYANKWPGIAEHDGRNAEGMEHAADLLIDFALSENDAWEIWDNWNQKNVPPMIESEASTVFRNGKTYGKHTYGCKRDRPAPQKTTAKPAKTNTTMQEQIDTSAQPIYLPLDQVTAKNLYWFWRNRIAFAMLSMVVGIEGLGKTFLALYLAACATVGRLWPDSENMDDAPVPGNVILMTSEDHLEYTIRPRFDAAGGDPTRLFALKGVRYPDGEDFFDVTRHLPVLEKMIEEIGDVRLVVADPLTAYLGTTDQHKNGEVRMALARFNALAEKYGCAVVGISHLSKDASKQAIHRTLGSVAFSAAARSILLVAQDKEDHDRRLLVPIKSNLGPLAKTLAFRINNMAVNWETGQFDCSADEALAAESGEDHTALADAEQWLRGLLADGRMRSTEILRLAKRESFVEKTVRRAKCKLGVVAVKEGVGEVSAWYWKLP